MDTNAVAVILQALTQKQSAPSGVFWEQMAPWLGVLIVAIAGWIKANTIERKADTAAVKAEEAKVTAKDTGARAEAAHEVARQSSETITKVSEELNGKSLAAIAFSKAQEGTVADLRKQLEELRARELQAAKESIMPETIAAVVAEVKKHS